MNSNDKKAILSQITSILQTNISDWSVIEVQQFLQIINCGLFSKIVRAFGINGQMLLEPTKIESLFVPQLKPSTTLLFEKMMFVIEELKPVKQTNSFFRLRQARRQPKLPIFITENLMKMFGMGIDFVRQRNIVLWSTEDLSTFLSVMGYSDFAKTTKETNCDGLIMLYILPDERKTVRTFKTLTNLQCREFQYVSQILVAQHLIQKTEQEDESKQTVFRRRLHSEAIIEIKAQQQSVESPENLKIISESPEQEGSPNNLLNRPNQQKLILQSIQNVQKQKQLENHKSNSGSGGNSLYESRQIRRQDGQQRSGISFENRSQFNDIVQSGSFPISRSYYPDHSKDILFARSYYPESPQKQMTQKSTEKNEIEFKFAKSQYSSLEASQGKRNIEVIDESAELDFQMIEQNNQKAQEKQKQWKEKQEAQKQKQQISQQNQQQVQQQLKNRHQKEFIQLKVQQKQQIQIPQQKIERRPQKSFALVISQFPSQSIKSIKFPSQSIKSIKVPQNRQKHNKVLQKIKAKKLEQQKQKKQNHITELMNACFQPPFNLLNFKALNSITLGEVKISLQDNLMKDCILVNGHQTFGVKGCKFGRNPQNDYCYPDEMAISSKHAMIFFLNNQFFLQDLGSKLGTFKQIDQIQIFDGLMIQLSFELEMTFELQSKNQQTLRIVFTDPKNSKNQAFVSVNKQPYYIGRAHNCHIPINSNYLTISGNHAKVYYQNNKFYFKDTKSRYGSWLRLSKKQVKSELFTLEKGDKIRISSKKIFEIFDIQVSQTLVD